MNESRAQRDLRINVLRADEVSIWQSMLELALELDRPDAPLRSVRLGCFDFIGVDGRTGRFSPALMAQVFEQPLATVASTMDKLLELKILARDGETVWIENAADWFIPASEHPPLRN